MNFPRQTSLGVLSEWMGMKHCQQRCHTVAVGTARCAVEDFPIVGDAVFNYSCKLATTRTFYFRYMLSFKQLMSATLRLWEYFHGFLSHLWKETLFSFMICQLLSCPHRSFLLSPLCAVLLKLCVMGVWILIIHQCFFLMVSYWPLAVISDKMAFLIC